ncbi:MAG: hypothetical protein IJ264_08165 [Clostridia bacterium]|nr:hypothetical protein [Clostridia bacterium]
MGFFLAIKNILNGILSIVFIIPILLTAWMPGDPDTPVMKNIQSENAYINEYLDPDISAHRSGAGVVPENTLMAFQTVLEKNKTFGVDTFEFDVQITKDGELIILHNLTYDETSNAVEEFGHKNVYASSLTYEEAHSALNLGENFTADGKTYPYRGLRGKDIPDNLRVAKCKDVIDYIEKNSKGKKYRYIIEIKSTSIDGMKAADELYSIIMERKLQDRVIWATSNEDVSIYMEKKYPDMTRSARTTEVIQFYIYARMNWDLNDLGVTYVALQIPFADSAAGGLANLGTRELINYAHKYDIAVQYWTVNDADDVEELILNGADCIMTDYPDMAYEVLKECK